MKRTCGAERSCKIKDALGKLTKIVTGVFKANAQPPVDPKG